MANRDFTKHVAVDAPGVSNDEIHVGAVTSKTNPVNGDYGLFDDGIQAYFDLVNSHGGIYGRTLKLTSRRDDQTASNTAQTQQLLNQDNVYAAFIATVLFTGAPVLAKAGIPTFGWNLEAEWAGPENFFPNVAPPVSRRLPAATPRVAVVGRPVACSPRGRDRLQRAAVVRVRERQRRRPRPLRKRGRRPGRLPRRDALLR